MPEPSLKVVPTKVQIKKILADNKIKGELSGRGLNWEVELPNEFNHRKFSTAFRKQGFVGVGGFKTGCGTWILRPGYEGNGEYGDKGSKWHY